MPKLRCACGKIIDLSDIPVEGQHFFIETKQWDTLIQSLLDVTAGDREVNSRLLGERFSDVLAGFGNDLYKCPGCDELIVVWQGSDVGQSYQPMDTNSSS